MYVSSFKVSWKDNEIKQTYCLFILVSLFFIFHYKWLFVDGTFALGSWCIAVGGYILLNVEGYTLSVLG